jgi:hypothetical protein
MFCRVNEDRPTTHHDMLEFPNGQIVMAARRYDGQ